MPRFSRDAAQQNAVVIDFFSDVLEILRAHNALIGRDADCLFVHNPKLPEVLDPHDIVAQVMRSTRVDVPSMPIIPAIGQEGAVLLWKVQLLNVMPSSLDVEYPGWQLLRETFLSVASVRTNALRKAHERFNRSLAKAGPLGDDAAESPLVQEDTSPWLH